MVLPGLVKNILSKTDWTWETLSGSEWGGQVSFRSVHCDRAVVALLRIDGIGVNLRGPGGSYRLGTSSGAMARACGSWGHVPDRDALYK